MVREHHYSCDDMYESVELPRFKHSRQQAGLDGPNLKAMHRSEPIWAGASCCCGSSSKDDNHHQQKYDVKFLLGMDVVVVIAVAM